MRSEATGGINLAVGDQFLGIYQGRADAKAEINHLCFGLKDFDAQRTVRALESAGLKAEARDRDGVERLTASRS